MGKLLLGIKSTASKNLLPKWALNNMFRFIALFIIFLIAFTGYILMGDIMITLFLAGIFSILFMGAL